MIDSSNQRDRNMENSFEKRAATAIEKFTPYFKVIWVARKRFIVVNAIVACVTILYLLLFVHPYYDSTVTIFPDYGSNLSSFGGLNDLASLAGVNIGEGSPMEVYENLLSSESVLEPVIHSKYLTEKFKDSVDLIQYFELKPHSSVPPELRDRDLFIVIHKMLVQGIITTDLERLSRILTVSVRMPESRLSAQVVNRIVESLDDYVRTKRKSLASNQRFYIEKRLSQVNDSLSQAEERLKDFNIQNRVIEQSPELILIQSRLSRNAALLQLVSDELTKQLELAKINEIKDTPVINIRELASDPLVKTGPSRRNLLGAVMLLSLLLTGSYYSLQNDIIEKWKFIKSNVAANFNK